MIISSRCPSTGDQEIAGLTHPTPGGQHHSFVEFDREIFSAVILFPSADSRRAVVKFWQKN